MVTREALDDIMDSPNTHGPAKCPIRAPNAVTPDLHPRDIVISALVLLTSLVHGLETARAAPAIGACTDANRFLVGSGIHDITGPSAERGMMGYARLDQRTAGIHMRLWSRAFVIASPCNDKRVVLVTADLAMITQAVRQAVVRRLQETFGGFYHDENVLLSATHTHAGPGGYSHYALYNLTVLGFDRWYFSTIVHGIYHSIVQAHDNLRPAGIKIGIGNVSNAGVNRSPEAYARNPESERARYPTDTDERMTLLKFTAADGVEIGTINWFAVHATSMGNENALISGDNKGYAAYLFERLKADGAAATPFVAAFAQEAEGDVSPNIYGGTNGGGRDDFESTQLSGEKQFAAALALYNGATEQLLGPVDYRFAYVKFDALRLTHDVPQGPERTTCPAAIGVSMLAGAEDGPGFGREGWSCEDLDELLPGISCAVSTTPCQAEKPIVLEMGRTQPFPLTPEVLPLQLVRVGSLTLIAVPFELTTMAGRRLRETVHSRLRPSGINHIVIAGLANAYAGYVTTREEYAAQHYEGASTHFGPWTLAALQQEFDRLAMTLQQGLTLDPGPTPRDLSCCQLDVPAAVLFDDIPLFTRFGDVYQDAKGVYAPGDVVRVIFWAGHPNNDFNIGGSYLTVERQEYGSWRTVAHDGDWETRYMWRRIHCLPTLACSHATIEWRIPQDAIPGRYRVRHHGHWRSGWDGKVRAYVGVSRPFLVR